MWILILQYSYFETSNQGIWSAFGGLSCNDDWILPCAYWAQAHLVWRTSSWICAFHRIKSVLCIYWYGLCTHDLHTHSHSVDLCLSLSLFFDTSRCKNHLCAIILITFIKVGRLGDCGWHHSRDGTLDCNSIQEEMGLSSSIHLLLCFLTG